jgi:hypothetical protein
MELIMKKTIASFVTALFLIGCADGGSTQNAGSHYNYTFAVDTEGWQGGFADYDRDLESIYELRFSHSTLPEPLDTHEGAVRISGNNHSDDLFMFMKTRINELDANATYAVTFTVEFASNVADGMVGIGGSPGEGVVIKAGATAFEPKAIVDGSGYYRMNIDKGTQTNSGRDMVVIGDFSNDSDANVYKLKTVRNAAPLHVTADENGSVWLIVGTDSGFEGVTEIYYNDVTVDLQKRD